MKKDAENKGKFGFGLLTKKEDQPEGNLNAEPNEELSDSEEEEEADLAEAEAEKEAALTQEEIQGEDSQEESDEAPEAEEAPAWLEMVVTGIGAKDPAGVPDKELLKIKGIGTGTLKQIREIYPYEKPKPAAKGKVMIRILPMRGIGGVGKAGTEAEMDREQAEQYVRDGYVEILE